MSQNAKSVKTALLAVAFFALVVAAAPRVFPPDVPGAVDSMASEPSITVAQDTANPAV